MSICRAVDTWLWTAGARGSVLLHVRVDPPEDALRWTAPLNAWQARRGPKREAYLKTLPTLRTMLLSAGLQLACSALQAQADPPQNATSLPVPASVIGSLAKPLPASPPVEASRVDRALPRVEIITAPETDDGAGRRESIAKSIYGREELDRQGDIDITDVLKRLPGVSMDGGAPRLRGLGGGYTQVLINGEPAPPGFSLDSLAPGDVERIEIIKGATAEYSGVAGTINIVLREPPRTLQREWRSSANYRAVQPGGSTAFQWGDRVGNLSFVLPLNVSLATQATQYHTERLSRTPAGEVQSQSIDGQDTGRSGSGQIAPRLQWKLNATDTLNLNAFAQKSASRSNSERHITALAGPIWTTADESQSQSGATVTRMQAQWLRKFTVGGKLELKSSWQTTARRSESDTTGRRDDGSTTVQRHAVTHFGESRASIGSRWSLPLGDAHSLVSGVEVEFRQRDELRRVWDNGVERIDSADGVPFAARIDRSAVFLQDEWVAAERWSVMPGLRLEQVVTRSGSAAAGTTEINNSARVVAPVLHMNYRLDAKGKDQIRASVTRSFKLPELSQLVGRYVLNTSYERDTTNTPIAADRAGNPTLQPELASGVDMAFEHYPTTGGVLSVGLFYRQIENLIRQSITLETNAARDVTTVPRWVSRPVNVGQATSQGLELEIKGRAEEWLPQWFDKDSGVQLRAAWNLYRSHVEQVDGPDNRLEAQPPWAANMGFDARIPQTGWTVGASWVLQPAYATQQTDRQISQRSPIRTLDAFANWKIDRSSQFRVGLTNLLAPDSVVSNSIDDLDGFSAGSTTRRPTLRAISVSLLLRY